MNSQKQKELQDNLKFMTEQFSNIEQPKTVPQRISAQAMQERVLHAKSQPRSCTVLFWGRWGRIAAAACAFVLIAATAWRFLGADNDKIVVAENQAARAVEDRMLFSAADEERPQQAAGAQADAADESAAVPKNIREFGASEEESAAEEVQESAGTQFGGETASSFSSYDELRNELSNRPEEQEKENSNITFGNKMINRLSTVTSNKVVSITGHTLYFGIDPQTQEKTDALFVLNSETKEHEKKITLPPKAKMDVAMHLPENEEHVILTAVGEKETHVVSLALKDFDTSNYILSGCMEDCWMKGDVLYFSCKLPIDEQMIEKNQFLPYVSSGKGKEFVPANRIYHLKDNSPPMQYLAVFAIDLKKGSVSSAAVLGAEMETEMLENELCILSTPDKEISITFSLKTMSPKE